jgi:hypothetical protein
VSAEASKPLRPKSRRPVIIGLAIGIFLLFAVIFSQQAFDLPFFRPNNEPPLVFAALSALIFLLLLALTFVLIRTLLKLYAERRGGVLGSTFRTRMVLGALLLSFAPVIFLFLFAYGLMNRSIDKWFSRPVLQVQQDTTVVANLLSGYAASDAQAEAVAIAVAPEVERAFATGNYAAVEAEFRRHDPTLQGGFVVALVGEQPVVSYHLPDFWLAIRARLPADAELRSARPHPIEFKGREYMMGAASVGEHGRILVAMPLPANFSSVLADIERSERRYADLTREHKLVRRTYMGLLLLLTVVVLFASTWFALFLSKFVTRPVAALAAATEQISRGHFEYRVDIAADDELGKLVQSFNRMASDLESNRVQLEASSRSLADANAALEQRRRHMETILESIPTGVLSLDAGRRITHANTALTRIFHSDGNCFGVGASLDDAFPPEVLDEIRPMLRQSDRMGTLTYPVELVWERQPLNLAVTVSPLRVDRQRLGYVLVFEDLSDLLKAQKQAAWREVARRVAHEIKNPLTPIALSAERIRRHLERGSAPDAQSLAVIRSCAVSIRSAVETVRTLVDEFSTLARFPTSQTVPSDINAIVERALALFDGRLDDVKLETDLAPGLPRVLADPQAMQRAIANLVDNAVEAMHDALVREVHISTALVSGREMVEIVVADTGHGVLPETKEKLFLPYFSTKKRGTGLGLAIVSRIIEDHQGTIRVEENLPIGARFVIELPLEEAGPANGNPVADGSASATHA